MCWGCVRRYGEDAGLDPDLATEWGAEIARRPTVVAAMDLIAAFYDLPDCGSGGPLHVVLDDSNVDDEFLHLWEPWFTTGVDDRVRPMAEAIVAAFRPMTTVERAVATFAWDPATRGWLQGQNER